MVKGIYRFDGENGPVLVEVDAPDERGPAPAGRAGEHLRSATRTFDEALSGIRPLADGVLEQVTSLSSAPGSCTVKFGIKLSGELGVILASSAAEAHLEVTLTWKRGEER